MSDIYIVADDRQGMNEILAVYDNEDAAEQHRSALEATDEMYGQYFTVDSRSVSSTPSDVLSEFTGLEDED